MSGVTNPDLSGKKILAATTDRFFWKQCEDELKRLGATVVIADASPHHPGNIPDIVREMETAKPNGVVIQNVYMDSDADAHDSVIGLVREAKKKGITPIVVDHMLTAANMQELREEGAVGIKNSDDTSQQVAFKIGDAILAAGRSGQGIGEAARKPTRKDQNPN